MHTLKEYPVYQHKGEPKRRWFTDKYFDVFVWFNDDNSIKGFQLCYDKKAKERALTWIMGRGFRHDLIDNGEATSTRDRSQTQVREEGFPANEVLVLFITSSGAIDERIRAFIIEKLCRYGNLPALDPTPTGKAAPPSSPMAPHQWIYPAAPAQAAASAQ